MNAPGTTAPAAPATAPAVPATARRLWLRILVVGLALWLATVVIIFLTGSLVLVPALVLLGSFLVPVTFVAWAFERRDTGEVTPGLLFSTFLTGGLLGVLAASVLEAYLLRPSPAVFIGVGLIEEGVKLGALVVLTRSLPVKSMRDGIVFGAAVGFGFSAFESAGYSFAALFTTRGLSVIDVVETEVLRSLLAPVGHGLWTAILGGVLFSAADRRHFNLGGRLFLALLGVAALHALWDAMHSIALWLTLLLTSGETHVTTPSGPQVQLTASQARLVPLLQWSGLALVALLGVVWLVRVWRASERTRLGPAGGGLPVGPSGLRRMAPGEGGGRDERNPASAAASSTGASSAMWWPESMAAARTSSAESRRADAGSP
jgi:RsiW-degrading membrane proteinase PrsW (M82 family)